MVKFSEYEQQLLDDLLMGFTYLSQDIIQSYFKHNKDNFKGTINDYFKSKAGKNILEKPNKVWGDLYQTIAILENYPDELDLNFLYQLSDKDSTVFINAVRKAKIAKEYFDKKLPSNLQVIKDALNTSISDKKDSNFQILNAGKCKITGKGNIDIINSIYQVKDLDIINHLKETSTNNFIMLCLYKADKDFKSNFYILFKYKDYLYILNNSENRVNINNSAGDRNPDRYIERAYKNIWLPVELFYNKGEKGIDKKKDMYVISKWDKLDSSYYEWIKVFSYVILDYIQDNKPQKALFKKEVLKLIGDHRDKKWEEGCNTYLCNLYKTKEIVLNNNIPILVGDSGYISEVINYEKRKLYAESINKRLWDDYNKNKRKIYNNIKEWVLSFGIEFIIKRALENNEYTYTDIPRFCHGTEKPTIRKKKILDENSLYCFGLDTNVISLIQHNCALCNKVKKKKIMEIEFIDYKQVKEFFKTDNIPKKIEKYLHLYGQWYMGNSILNDIDPMESIKSPWFYENTTQQGYPCIKVCFPICNRCIKKCRKEQ